MNQPFIVSHYPARPRSPWKLELRASFYGKKIRRFFQSEAEAFSEGNALVATIREKGTQGLYGEDGMSVAQALRMWSVEAEGKSKSHADKIAATVKELSEVLKGPVARVEPLAIDRWLKTLGGSETSRAMWFRYARMFFKWCYRMRFIDRSPLDGLRPPRATPGRNILTPEQMAALLKAPMGDDVKALVLLGGFAGLRTVEVARMNWEDIDTKTKQIHVRPEVSKQHDGMLQRIVDMTEPLVKRRKFFEKKTGRIVTSSVEALHERRRKVALALGWEGWPDNALRHSFATYHLGRCGNSGLTAYQMGHTSPAMVQRVYAVPAVRADWKAFWRI
jgi:integrase